MPKFRHIKARVDGCCEIDYGFMLTIEGPVDLAMYMMGPRLKKTEEWFLDFSRDGHARTAMGSALKVMEELGASVVYKLAENNQRMFKILGEYISEGHTAYINKSGGYMLDNSIGGLEIVREVCKDDYIFPLVDDTVECVISKFPNGKHYFVSFNGTKVEIDGVEKWMTESDAVSAARLYEFKSGLKISSLKTNMVLGDFS